MSNNPRLSRITIFPVKALAGVSVGQAEITSGGTLKGDRRWAIMDRKGRPINGKNNSQIYSFNTSFDLENEQILFNDDTNGDVTFDLNNTAQLADYLSDQLNKSVTVQENAVQGFPDDPEAYGPTLVSEASLLEVMTWYPNLSLEEIRARFRINLEVSYAPAFWEDQCFVANKIPKTVSIGHVLIQATNPCARCAVPMKDSNNGKPYSDFYETFIEKREQTKPTWIDDACFDHWYRLSINTKVPYTEAGKIVTVGDKVNLNS